MAALDFPLAPTIGQTYPNPAVTGTPVYRWDGNDWLSAYPVGPVILPGDPTDPLGAATKQYVDNTLAYSGMQINGSFDVDQASVAATVTNTYACDGWLLGVSGSMALTAYRANFPGLFAGLPNFGQILVGTASPSLTGADQTSLFTRIEGNRVARLAWGTASAVPITIGFWTCHIRAGTYSVAVRNWPSPSRSYVTTYTQNVSNAPEYKTVTIPGCTDGTWAVDNTTGLVVGFTMACSPLATAPAANVWSTGNYIAAPGQVNAVAATSDIFRITGVVVLPGARSLTAAQSRLIMRPYDQELMTCKRYFAKQVFSAGEYIATGQANATTAAQIVLTRFYTEMRSVPTMQASAAGNFSLMNAGGGTQACTALNQTITINGVYAQPAVASSFLTAGNATVFLANAVSLMQFDARL